MSLSKRELMDALWTHTGTYEDFPEGSERYYAQWAIDEYDSAVRDNSLAELISIGQRLESEVQGAES